MFRITLIHMFIVTSAAALAAASLSGANVFWKELMLLYMVLAVVGALLYATVEQNVRRTFAIAFLVGLVAYGLLIFGNGLNNPYGTINTELTARQGTLPTSLMLAKMFKTSPQPVVRTYGGWGASTMTPSTTTFEPREDAFMVIGHCWWAVLLGYIFGHVARIIYCLICGRPVAPEEIYVQRRRR